MDEHKIDALLSVGGLRATGAGLMFLLAPRWFRRLLEDFIKLSDNHLRVIGYVLLGAGASILAQQSTRRVLSAKIETLLKKERGLGELPIGGRTPATVA